MKILGIDTSGKVASAAITDGEKLLWEKAIYTKLTHSQIILPMVKEALKETELDFSDIDCIAVAKGPGSYTGLRIGIGAVKGICMGQPRLKCAGVSTLLAFAYANISFCGKIISVMRARPKIVYAGEFLSDGENITRISDDKVSPEEEIFQGLDTTEKLLLTGDCAAEIKAKHFFENPNVILAPFIGNLQKASSLCLAAERESELITTADKLEVSYLQATKAEKDKAHRDN